MQAYLQIVKQVLEQGTLKPSRTGVWTLSCFGLHYRMDLADGFPLMTTKKVNWKNIVIENLWFLSGARDVSLLHKHGCHFWDPWIRDSKTLEVPSPYGFFWRHYPDGSERGLDQIAYVIEVLKREPYSRRLLVSAWNPPQARSSALPPCHSFWQLLTTVDDQGENRLHLHLFQRSCDIALGLPYNIAGYALILSLLSQICGMRAGEFVHSISDAHVYTTGPEQSQNPHDQVPALREQLKREPQPLPRLQLDPKLQSLEDLEHLAQQSTEEVLKSIALQNYRSHPALHFNVVV